MAITVQFFEFSKKHNSTAIPNTSEDVVLSILAELKTESSIINPILLVNYSGNPIQMNYAYIPAFKRYYYINNWIWRNGIWEAVLSCDVLATYKTTIGASSQYILRAASKYDGSIIDTLYPASTSTTGGIVQSTAKVWNVTNYNNGILIVSIVNGATNTGGAASYYLFTAAGYRSFCNTLMSNVDWLGEISDISEELQKALINPLQYVTSVFWFPLTVAEFFGSLSSSTYAVTSISYSWWTISVSNCYRIPMSIATKNITFGINLPAHPQAEDRGSFCNMPPFTRYNLALEPFGIIPIDASKVKNNHSISGSVLIDMTTGIGLLNLTGDNSEIIAKRTEQIGVQMPIAQSTQDVLGAASSVVSAATGALTSAATGNISGAIQSAASGITSAVKDLSPQVSVKGAAGALIGFLYQYAYVDYQFFKIVDDSISHLGRPACKTARINTYSGYIMTADADISLAGTETEKEQVKQFMDSGFFYE